jgi:hypothetical protein
MFCFSICSTTHWITLLAHVRQQVSMLWSKYYKWTCTPYSIAWSNLQVVGTHFSSEQHFGTEKHTHGRSPIECVGHGNSVTKYRSQGSMLLSATQKHPNVTLHTKPRTRGKSLDCWWYAKLVPIGTSQEGPGIPRRVLPGHAGTKPVCVRGGGPPILVVGTPATSSSPSASTLCRWDEPLALNSAGVRFSLRLIDFLPGTSIQIPRDQGTYRIPPYDTPNTTMT